MALRARLKPLLSTWKSCGLQIQSWVCPISLASIYNHSMPPPDHNLADWLPGDQPERACAYPRGSILYWQGDPVERLFVIQKGAVKISSVSSAGKIYSLGILGAGHLLGAAAGVAARAVGSSGPGRRRGHCRRPAGAPHCRTAGRAVDGARRGPCGLGLRVARLRRRRARRGTQPDACSPGRPGRTRARAHGVGARPRGPRVCRRPPAHGLPEPRCR